MRSRFPIVELGRHVRQVSQRNRSEADIEVFSVTNSEGFTRSTDYFSKEVFSKDVSNYKIVSPGQFAYNPSRINVGSIDYLRHGRPVLVSPLYVVFEGDNGIHADYLLRYLQSDWGNAQIRANTEGAVRDSLKFKGLENIKIPLPLSDDQIRIAHLLGKVEGLIAQRKQHLQQLDDLLRSVFLEMFGDPVRNEKRWDKFPIEQIVENARNGLSPSKGGEFDGLVYTLSSVTGEAFREIFKEDVFSKLDNSYIPSARDFLVCRGNGNINLVGRGHFYPALRDDIMFPDTVIALTIKKGAINSKFLEVLWQTKFIRAQIEKAARTANGTYKINQKSLCQVEIIAPPSAKQIDFEKVAAKLEKLGTKYKQTLVDLEALYGVLSQQAFKGELDLSQVPLPPNQGSQIHGEHVEQQADRSPLPDVAVTPTEVVNSLVQGTQPQERDEMLARWFSRYLTNTSPDASLGSTRLLESAWQTLQETQQVDDGETQALTLDDYDALRNWLFKALATGELNQSFDANSNRVLLQKQSANWGTW